MPELEPVIKAGFRVHTSPALGLIVVAESVKVVVLIAPLLGTTPEPPKVL